MNSRPSPLRPSCFPLAVAVDVAVVVAADLVKDREEMPMDVSIERFQKRHDDKIMLPPWVLRGWTILVEVCCSILDWIVGDSLE